SAASAAAMLLFGFSQYSEIGNYNYATPYSHDATHGLALSVLALVCLHRAARGRALAWSGAAGFCYGLVLLTKPETGLAAGVGGAAAWLAWAALGADDRRHLARAIPVFAALAAAPIALFFAYFVRYLAPVDALRAVAGAWAIPNRAAIATTAFYVRGMGLDDP